MVDVRGGAMRSDRRKKAIVSQEFSSQAVALLARNEWVVVDVRDSTEFTKGRVPGTWLRPVALCGGVTLQVPVVLARHI